MVGLLLSSPCQVLVGENNLPRGDCTHTQAHVMRDAAAQQRSVYCRSVCCRSVCCRSVCCRSVCCRSVCCRSVCCRSVCWRTSSQIPCRLMSRCIAYKLHYQWRSSSDTRQRTVSKPCICYKNSKSFICVLLHPPCSLSCNPVAHTHPARSETCAHTRQNTHRGNDSPDQTLHTTALSQETSLEIELWGLRLCVTHKR